jgi:hypothetical protein
MRLRPTFLFIVALTVAAGAPACSSQGEGDVCDQNAGNMGTDDCQSGLVCMAVSNLGTRCCPPPPAQATTGICASHIPTVNPNAETGPPSDAAVGDVTVEGAPDAPNTEAAPEGGPDSGVDAPGEAAADAPQDSPGG